MAKDFNIARSAGYCVRCEKPLVEREEYMAVVVDHGAEFERQDWCLACWDAPGREPIDEAFGQWRTAIPAKEARKKLFVDDDLLMNFFQRLADDPQPARQRFRFVLTLVLMRKRLLTYVESVKADDGADLWRLRQRGTGDMHDVIDPHLDEDQIAGVSEQLSDILQGEL